MSRQTRKILITGVTSGFGVEWLYGLDAHESKTFGGSELFVVARNKEKFETMNADRPLKCKTHFIGCDLASQSSVKKAAASVMALTDHLDVLINNAGVFAGDTRQVTEDDVEVTLGVNQLAPYLLTGLLLPLLHAAPQGRIVNTASFRHSDAKISYDDIEMQQSYSAEQAYCNSKLYTVLFTQQLAERLKGSGVTATCFDPGIVDTPMLDLAFPKAIRFLLPIFRRFAARTPEKGAETGLYLSVAKDGALQSGRYFHNKKTKALAKVANNTSASWLWQECERLTGFEYDTFLQEAV